MAPGVQEEPSDRHAVAEKKSLGETLHAQEPNLVETPDTKNWKTNRRAIFGSLRLSENRKPRIEKIRRAIFDSLRGKRRTGHQKTKKSGKPF